ncbi:PRTRC system protein E [Pedobacter sp. ISL-68]|uniref:PRTRC system protein E n=1 Tax=unclassified Pedobacter TaxID=2628915 RepID=UPI001BE99307|nr:MULTISPECIES: PRTRC system protein E [unclassified Pedobacter]MBT2559858.1 PRTRC system protein E [Pedobacter sp. ISL-64]MBT2592163.1 PRTRC system protein E [Pedobacter sp. ISL-68]
MDTTNFFKQIAQMNITGDIQITLKKGAENNWIVSVLLNNEHCGDNAKNLIVPCTLRGTAEELDDDFFGTITSPLERASGLMVNMESFMKQLEESKKQSAMEKEKTEKEKKEKDGKDKKFQEAMSKSTDLEKELKYKESWTALPKIGDFPEHSEAIRKRMRELEKFLAPSLFNFAPEPQEEKPEPEKGALYPDHMVDTVEQEMESEHEGELEY